MKRLSAFLLGLLLVCSAAFGQLAQTGGGKPLGGGGGGGAGGAITWQSVSTASAVGSVATQNVTYQASIASGEKLLLIQSLRTSTDDNPADPSGWTRVTSAVGGVDVWGSESGNTRVTVWEKTAAGTESGGSDVTITWSDSSASTAVAIIVRLTGANAGWQATTATSGEDETGPAISVTGGGSLSFLTNDLLIAAYGTNTSNGIGTSEALVATGATLGSVTVRSMQNWFVGNDVALDVFSAAVSSGTATVAPQGTLTWSEGATPATTGVMVFVRVRNAT